MERFKRILIGLAAVAGLILCSTRAGAQGAPVIDIASIITDINNFAEEMLTAGEELTTLMETLNKSEEMVKKTKSVYNKVSSIVNDGKAMYDIYRETERIEYDFKALENYIRMLSQYGKITPSKIKSLRMMGTTLAVDLENVVKDIKEFLDSKNDMTNADRQNGVEKKSDEMSSVREMFEKTMHDDALGLLYAELERNVQLNTLNALGMLPTLVEEKEQEERIEDITKEVMRKAGMTTKDEDLYVHEAEAATTVDRVFNFVTAVIGVMAVLMLVWAFAIRTKGEERHNDALWKVFAGLIFILLLLQVLKVTIFGAHGFDMILPKF